jgi:hypothetical protein
VVTWSAPAYQPDRAGCHAQDFKVGGPHRTATVSDLRDCAGACHTSPEHSVRENEWWGCDSKRLLLEATARND